MRLDARLQHEGDELLVDCTIIHPLSRSHARAETKRTLERLDSTVLEVRNKPAAAINTAKRKKEQAYIPFIYVLKKQVMDGRRQRAGLHSYGSHLLRRARARLCCRAGVTQSAWKKLKKDIIFLFSFF